MVEVRPFDAAPDGTASPEERAVARALAERSERRDEHPALGDAVWLDLAVPGPGSRGFFATVPGGDGPVGYLRAVDRGATGVECSMTVHPDHRDDDVPGALLDAGLTHAHAIGAPAVTLWIFGADVDADALASGRGLRVDRELWQMRTLLPVAGAAHFPADVTVAPFRPGLDDVEWLAVNARSFAADPDQGTWTATDLAARLTEAWFRADGFLVARRDGRIVGSCWTKVHPASPPHEPHPLGEIYVVGVDPAAHGEGLGRALVVAGLSHLHAHGLAVGMLFVDAANTAAVGLYRSLGFVTSRVDRSYRVALL